MMDPSLRMKKKRAPPPPPPPEDTSPKKGSIYMLENLCSRTVQSSRGVCSRRVNKIVNLAVKKGNIWSFFFTSESIHRELSSLINPAVYLLNKLFVG